MSKGYEITDSFVINSPTNVSIRAESAGGGSLIILFKASGFDTQNCEEKLARAKDMLLRTVTEFVNRKD